METVRWKGQDARERTGADGDQHEQTDAESADGRG
jgi:hypothetical protein